MFSDFEKTYIFIFELEIILLLSSYNVDIIYFELK